jgi:hypothetical protein
VAAPTPRVTPRTVLVDTRASLISAGTGIPEIPIDEISEVVFGRMEVELRVSVYGEYEVAVDGSSGTRKRWDGMQETDQQLFYTRTRHGSHQLP